MENVQEAEVMEEAGSEKKRKKYPDWIIRQGLLPPMVKVLCPDEDHCVILRGMTAQAKGELEAQKDNLSDLNYAKKLICNCVHSWTLVDMDNDPLPQLKETTPGKDQNEKIWDKMPGIWADRIVAGIQVLEFPGEDDALGGEGMLRGLIPETNF